jgi:type VI secretion system protein ImpJ
MARRHKVVWHEGMALDPHHFQQADRYAQATLNARINAVAHYGWGLTELEIDREGVPNGQFAVQRCRGVTPDGLPFNCPDDDTLPEIRAFDKLFPANEDRLGVFIAIPLERVSGINTQLLGEPAKREMRFVMEQITVLDDNTGAEERTLGIGRPNFSLRFSTERQEDYSTIKIAEIELDRDGRFTLSKSFIPPCLALAASENLATVVNKVLNRLNGKSTELRQQLPPGQREYTKAAIDTLWRLHTVNTFIPVLTHHFLVTKCHPETLYSYLLMLAGQLTTFADDEDVKLRDFPRYEHNNLAECFGQMHDLIEKLLSGLIKEVYEKVNLARPSQVKWISEKVDEASLQNKQFYLMCSGDIPVLKMSGELPRQLKITAPEILDALVGAALPGLGVSFMPHAPVGLPSRPGLHYLRLDKTGPHWEKICQSHGIGIFIPAEYAGINVELVTTKET